MRLMCILGALYIFFQHAYAVEALIVVKSNETWKGSRDFSEGWYEPMFDDSNWTHVRSPTRGRCDFYEDPIFFAPPMWLFGALERGEAHFRTSFTVEKKIEKALLRANFDDDGDVYINGEKVLSERSGKTEKVYREVDITNNVRVGSNVIAVYAIDSFGGCQWASVDVDVTYDTGIYLDVPEYKQLDQKWSNETYDHAEVERFWCGTTMKDCGCATTSLAMLLHGYGIKNFSDGVLITPQSLNIYMKEGGQCMVDGCVSRGYVFGAVRWDVVHGLSVNAHRLLGSPKIQLDRLQGYVPDDARDSISQGNPVIIKSPHASHWFVGYGYNKSVFIRDPLYEHKTLLEGYGDTASKMVVYKKVNSDFRQIQAFVRKGGTLTMTDIYGQKVGVHGNEVYLEVPHASYNELEVPNSSSTGEVVQQITIYLPTDSTFYIQGAGFMITSDKNAQESIFSIHKGAVRELRYFAEKPSLLDPPRVGGSCVNVD